MLSWFAKFLTFIPEIRCPHKRFKNCLVIIIYGIEVDSEKKECRLPQDKIVNINTALISAMHRKKITLRSLQSLIGLLKVALD
jgi:hypothetical protein